MCGAKAFTLVEILIVVVLLGVVATVIVPTIGRSSTTAKESVLLVDLNLLRRFIPVYTGQHLEIPPGYPAGDRSASPTGQAFFEQATLSSDRQGRTAARGTPGFPFGPYLSNIPPNPFNRRTTVEMVEGGASFPETADDSHGWIYKPVSGEIRADCKGADVKGVRYYDY
jgi:prepilin-type N-terminal cleavage/methylation domain-containing protein